jgi:hypothetical protein
MGFGSLNGIKAKDPVVFFETPSYWDHSNPKYQVFGEKGREVGSLYLVLFLKQ